MCVSEDEEEDREEDIEMGAVFFIFSLVHTFIHASPLHPSSQVDGQ